MVWLLFLWLICSTRNGEGGGRKKTGGVVATNHLFRYIYSMSAQHKDAQQRATGFVAVWGDGDKYRSLSLPQAVYHSSDGAVVVVAVVWPMIDQRVYYNMHCIPRLHFHLDFPLRPTAALLCICWLLPPLRLSRNSIVLLLGQSQQRGGAVVVMVVF